MAETMQRVASTRQRARAYASTAVNYARVERPAALDDAASTYQNASSNFSLGLRGR